MNGVRRFLGGGGTTPEPATPPAMPATAPLFITGKSSWPPSSPPAQSPTESLEFQQGTTAALFTTKKKPSLPPQDDFNPSFQSSRSSNGYTSRPNSHPLSPTAVSSSSRVPPLPNRVSQLSRRPTGTESKRSSQMLNVRDDLLMSLLASEAIVDSRGCEILSSEEVEELKKEQQVLSSRLVAMNKKLQLETKIRDAAASLSKVNSSYKNVNKQTSEQLDTANRKVELAQKELWRVSERANEVQRKLLEHRAGVLSQSVRNLEKKNESPDGTTTSGYSTPNRSSQMSPTNASSVTSVQTASSKGRFDGAHFFAGHVDAIMPLSPRLPQSVSTAVNNDPELETKLQELTAALEAATARQTEMEQELSLVRLEKEEIETSLGMQLHSTEDTLRSMEGEVARMTGLDAQLQELKAEREDWAAQRNELEERRQQVEHLNRRVQELELLSGSATVAEGALAAERAAHMAELEKKSRELDDVKAQWEAQRSAWDLEKITLMGDMNEQVTRLQKDAASGSSTKSQLEECLNTLHSLMLEHGLTPESSQSTPADLVTAVGKHLDDVKNELDHHAQLQEEWTAQRARLETDARVHLEKHASLANELDQLRRERDDAKSEIQDLQAQLQAQQVAALAAMTAAAQPPIEYKGDVAQIIAQLQPVWAILPSAEARASKLGTRTFRTGSPTNSPVTPRGGGGGGSLSEMDVRSLKNLYDPKGFALSSGAGGTFSVEAFVERVQALVTDDRALVERLIRFAQAHDLLKKNAERAQKLALDSNSALETYQKQVNTLEERNMALMKQQAELEDEVHWLQETVERLQAEKLDIETQAAEQAETCAQLTEANNTLSAKALMMADEAASTTDSVRRQLDSQLAEARSALAKAKDELENTQRSQQTQQMALLEELNTVQTENTNLRNQLRAKK